MSYHWTKSKYKSVHIRIIFARLVGFVITFPLLFIFGDSFIGITAYLFLMFFLFGFSGELSLYLTGEEVGRMRLIVDRSRKKQGTINQLIMRVAKTAIISAAVLAAIFKIIIIYR